MMAMPRCRETTLGLGVTVGKDNGKQETDQASNISDPALGCTPCGYTYISAGPRVPSCRTLT